MRKLILLPTLLILATASCNNIRTQDNSNQEIPKALKEKSSTEEYISKRSYSDLVDNLYDELVSKNIELKKFEEQISELNNSKGDTTEKFEIYNDKNQSYFTSANSHIAGIKDSLLREKMQNFVADNFAKYNLSIVKHKELLKLIDSKNLTIADLHVLIKIVKTMPLMETYQKDNLPNIKSLEGFINQQNATLKYADSLAKK